MKIETLLMTQEKWKQKGEGKHQEKVDDLDRNVPSPEVVATIQGGLYLITVILDHPLVVFNVFHIVPWSFSPFLRLHYHPRAPKESSLIFNV